MYPGNNKKKKEEKKKICILKIIGVQQGTAKQQGTANSAVFTS